MPVPDYLDIPDSDIDPESPINYSLLARLRDNILAVIGGGTGAPTMTPRLLGIMGSLADGVLDDSWAPTNPGYYDFDGDEPSILSSPRTLPNVTIIRHNGDLNISAAQTLDTISPGADVLAGEALGLAFAGAGTDGDNVTAGTSGGGGSHASAGGDAGTTGNGGTARPLSSLLRWWISRRIPAGNVGGGNGAAAGGPAGGVLVLLIEGDLDMTGGSIVASGGTGGTSSGGGAGGTILILCTGTITNGTFTANGGAASAQWGGGGAGGVVGLIASAFAGSQTFNHSGGNGGHGGGHPSGNTGSAGYDVSVTVPAETLRGLIWR